MTQTPQPQQWMLNSQQVLNWGCFDGYWRVTFADAGQVTMFSGKTGSGKSTFLDSNTVLMQPSRTRLNRASNAVTTGHARNESERNIVSYMRGLLDKTREGADEVHKVLREGTVWSAIAQTWHNADSSVVTAFVAYFARPDDRTSPSVKRFGYVDGEFDLRCLEPYTQAEYLSRPLPPRAIKRDYPAVQFEDNQSSLHRRLWQKLGIGNGGDGDRAMELLHRVQSSDTIDSVNELFTRLVLDEPSTFAKAAEAVNHFARLSETHKNVAVIEDQIKILEGISSWWSIYCNSKEASRFYTLLNATTDKTALTPFWKWMRSREYDLLDAREQQNSRDRTTYQDAVEAAASSVQRIENQLAENEAKRQANGGALIDQIDRDIRLAEETRDRADAVREQLQEACAAYLQIPNTAEEHDKQVLASRVFEGAFPERREGAKEAWKAILGEKYPLLSAKANLMQERRHLAGRGDLIPEALTEIRQRYSDLTQISVMDMPFVAELIDMGPEWQDWRTAAELTLGGYATHLLIPAEQAAKFRALTDQERTARRINSLPVPLTANPVCERDPDTLAGRFVFSDHPYASWLSHELRQRFDHLCVADGNALSALPAGRRGVTLAGQVLDSRRGSHGGQKNHKRIIGFSPQARLDEIEDEIARLEDELAELDMKDSGADEAIKVLEAEHSAHTWFLRTTWSQMDAQVPTELIQKLTRQRADALANEALAALDAERRRLLEQAKEARSSEWSADHKLKDAKNEHTALVTRKDRVWDHIQRLDHVQEPDMDRMDALLRKHLDGRNPTVDDFAAIGPFVKVIDVEASRVASEGKSAHGQMVTAFTNFLRDYPDSDLTTDPDLSYAEFKTILDGHLSSGVAEAKAEFANYTATFSGLEVMHLNTAYQNEMEMIFKRLNQVNTILNDQPYGADGRGRISIQMRPGGMSDEAVTFLRRLTELTSQSTRDLTYEEAVERFTSFREVIGKLADPRTAGPLLDVRRHIRLEAQHHDENGNLVAIHDTLAGKSGGETQELTMFIIAAAIRYQVGSLDNDKPRFAPVFLDEGMVKADPETTQRAAAVWRRLGFQPIIAVPLDKHESVMVEADMCWSVSKDDKGRSRFDWMKPEPRSSASVSGSRRAI